MLESRRKRELISAISSVSAYCEIENLIQRAAVAFMFHQADRLKKYFWMDNNVSIEFPEIDNQYGAMNVSTTIDRLVGAPLKPGEMVDCHLCSPDISINPNMSEALGHWKVISAIGKATLEGKEAAKAMWGMGKLSVNFVFENQEWYIAAVCYKRNVLCDYDDGWSKEKNK